MINSASRDELSSDLGFEILGTSAIAVLCLIALSIMRTCSWSAGGDPADLNPYVRSVVRSLIPYNIGPAWVGINPTSGPTRHQVIRI